MTTVLPCPGLLVSVRSAAEAQAALSGGAAIIDVKEPSRGPLGRADDAVIAEVVRVVAGRCPVSAALGELVYQQPLPTVPGLQFVKWGMAGAAAPGWRPALDGAVRRMRECEPRCQGVAVAYADWHRAIAPIPEAIAAIACQCNFGAFLLDTCRKDGTTLLDWLPRPRIEKLCRVCRTAGVRVALAGALTEKEIGQLYDIAPDWFAVRGAACVGGRTGNVDAEQVRQLVQFLDCRV